MNSIRPLAVITGGQVSAGVATVAAHCASPVPTHFDLDDALLIART